MHYRYHDCEDEDGRKSLRKWRWLRWVMFALGGAPAAVKLAAFKGVPFTKAVGMIWVISWVVVEILSLLSGNFHCGIIRPLTLKQHTLLGTRNTINRMNSGLELISRITSALLCIWLVQDVLFGGFHRISAGMFLYLAAFFGYIFFWVLRSHLSCNWIALFGAGYIAPFVVCS
jgi:hypothetical protein